jgi:aconitate hydratase
LKAGDNISTDEIMPAGSQILPYRSNIPEISKYAFIRLDDSFYDRAMRDQQQGFVIIAGNNYGQGSSREHAAIAPRYLGLKAVVAKSFARIHWQNLVNFGMLPLTFVNSADYDAIDQGDELEISDVHRKLNQGDRIQVTNKTKHQTYDTQHVLSKRQIEMIVEGSLINVVRKRQK